jgi:hypothetical protein
MRRMISVTKIVRILLALVLGGQLALADATVEKTGDVRVLSWNISSNAFVRQPEQFQARLRYARADVLLLDEVRPSATREELELVLAGLEPDNESEWRIDYGTSGGRQRGVIASRKPLEALPEFSTIIPYPDDARAYILEAMSAHERANTDLSMEHGIPVNGAVVLTGKRRLLVVVADLQCCGEDRASWQEYRRRVESREIRLAIRQVLERTEVDGIILAGDFNLVNSAFPISILAGPFPPPHAGLIPVEAYHLDESTAWTWDGRGTPFPSGTLDFQLYGPHSLQVRKAVIVDSDDLGVDEREQYGLESENASWLSRHRPLLVDYYWQ